MASHGHFQARGATRGFAIFAIGFVFSLVSIVGPRKRWNEEDSPSNMTTTISGQPCGELGLAS
jgi:hypothetical protein